jgi:hypothetical protein
LLPAHQICKHKTSRSRLSCKTISLINNLLLFYYQWTKTLFLHSPLSSSSKASLINSFAVLKCFTIFSAGVSRIGKHKYL